MTQRAFCVLVCLLAMATPIAHADADDTAPQAATVATVHVAPATLAPMQQYLTAYGTLAYSADALHAISVPYQARVEKVAVVAG